MSQPVAQWAASVNGRKSYLALGGINLGSTNEPEKYRKKALRNWNLLVNF